MHSEVLHLLVFAVWVQDLRTRTYFGGMCDFSTTKKMISRRLCFFFKISENAKTLKRGVRPCFVRFFGIRLIVKKKKTTEAERREHIENSASTAQGQTMRARFNIQNATFVFTNSIILAMEVFVSIDGTRTCSAN